MLQMTRVVLLAVLLASATPAARAAPPAARDTPTPAVPAAVPGAPGETGSASSTSKADRPSTRVSHSASATRPRAALAVATCLYSPMLAATTWRLTSRLWPGGRSPTNQETVRVV